MVIINCGIMTNYKYKDTINYFGEVLKTLPPIEDIEEGEVELILDDLSILLKPGLSEGSFQMTLDLALFVNPPQSDHLAKLAAANFLGVDTGGCSLCLDDEGAVLSLKAVTTPGTTPQENWDWLHRIVSIAHEWANEMEGWSEVTLLVNFKNAEARERLPNVQVLKA